MTPQHPQDSRNTAGICPCCPREEPCRRQHVVHCRDTSGKDSVRPGMTRGTSLRRRPYMKPLSSLLEQAPPSLVLDLMDTCRLETRHRDFLWRQGPQEIRQALLDCDGFLIGLTESQARDILTTGNVPLLCRLATLLPGRAQSPYRLSRATHEKLWRHLRGHPDMRIREALAGNDALPPAFAISFADRIRQHLPFCRTTFRDLRQEDVGLLLRAPISGWSKRSLSCRASVTGRCAGPSSRECWTIRILSSVWSCPAWHGTAPIPCARTARCFFRMSRRTDRPPGRTYLPCRSGAIMP